MQIRIYRHIHVHCSVLQCGAVRCSVLQYVAVCHNVLRRVPSASRTPPASTDHGPLHTRVCIYKHRHVHCSALQRVAVRCSALHYVAICHSVLRRVASASCTPPASTSHTSLHTCVGIYMQINVCCSACSALRFGTMCCSVLQCFVA